MITIGTIKARGQKPRFHGNGFFQLYLDEAKTRRWHVWHPYYKPQRDHNAQIHDHRFDMKSRILLGRLHHTTYDAHAADSILRHGDLTHNVYEIKGASKFDENVMHNLGAYQLERRHDYVFNTGSEYTFRRGMLHTSYVASEELITSTVITRSNMDKEAWARVAVQKDVDINDVTHAFQPELQPSEEEAWKVMESAFNLMGYAGRRSLI